MNINYSTLVEGVKEYFETLTLRIVAATKAEEGKEARSFRMPNKDGREFIAMNAMDQQGRRYDLEISSAEGFAGDGIVNFETGQISDFTPPPIGALVKVLNGSIRMVFYKGMRKYKVNVASAAQLELFPILARNTGIAPVKGRRARRAV